MDPWVEIIEDPYIGLRLQAWQVQQIQMRAVERTLRIARLPPIRGGAPGIFDDIADFLRKVWEYISTLQWVTDIYNNIILPFFEALKEGLLNRLINLVTPLISAITTTLEWWMKQIYLRLQDVWQNLYNAISNVVTQLKASFGPIIAQIREKIEAIRLALHSKISELITRIRETIANLRAAISERIQNLIARIVEAGRALRERLSIIFANLMERITTGLRELRERIWQAILEAVRRLREVIGDKLRNFFNLVMTAIRQWWRQHGPQILDAAERAIKLARPHIERWVGEFQKLPAKFLEYVATSAGTDLALQPSRALAVAGTLYTTSLLAGSLAMTLSTALNIIPAINWVGAQQFSAYIAEAAGFEPLTRATYGTLLNECLVWPLRYHWNQMLRPKIPTEGSIFLMGRKRGLDEREFFDAMAYQGLPDEWIDRIYTYFWTDPSPYWLLRMSEAAVPDIKPSDRMRKWLNKWLPGWRNDPWAWYKMKLMLAGFEDTDIPSFIEGFQRRRLMSPITQFKTSVRAMLREAYWYPRDARAALTPLKVQLEEIALIVAAEELDYQKRYLDEQRRVYQDAFRKEEMDAEDLFVALSTFIVKPERVHQIVAREKIRKLPKPKPPKAPKEDPDVAKIRAQAIRGHTLMLRKRVIGPIELYTYLMGDGLSEELARVTTITELVSRIKAPPLDSPYFLSKSLQILLQEEIVKFRDLYDEGKMTVGQYLNALLAMGIDEDTAIYLADVAQLDRFLEKLPA